MAKFYLDPHRPSGVEPCADLNVRDIGNCCLDVNTKDFTSLIGRGSMAWLTIWFGLFCFIGFSLSSLYINATVLQFIVVPISVAFYLALPILFWAYRVGNNRYPVRFCRKNRKVYIYIKNQLHMLDWDTIPAYISNVSMVSATGTPFSDSHLNIEFQHNGKTLTLFILGTERSKKYIPKNHQALAIWEYIRTYMEQGPEYLPDPNPRMPYIPLEDMPSDWDPFPVANGNSTISKIFGTIFFPLRLISAITLFYPTDVLYYLFHQRFIHPKPFPEEYKVPDLNHCTEEQLNAADEFMQQHKNTPS